MNRRINITWIILITITFLSCGNQNYDTIPNKVVQEPVEPGQSELSILMREMFDEAKAIQEKLANKDSVQIAVKHESILTASATDPSQVSTVEYKAFANAYLETIDKFGSTGRSEYQSLYDEMVNNCIVCHKSICPGPLTRIETLVVNPE